MPAFEIVQAETLHVKLLHALLLDDVHGVVRSHGRRAAVAGVTGRPQFGDVLAGAVVIALLHIGLGTDQVLLRKAEHLGHRNAVDIVARKRQIAEILGQQRPCQPVAVTGGHLAENRRGTQVVAVVQIVKDPVGRHVVGTVARIVVVGENRSQGTAVGVDRKGYLPDGFGRYVHRPHILVQIHLRTADRRILIATGERVITAVDYLGGVFHGILPVFHVKGHARPQGINGVFVEIPRAVKLGVRGSEVVLQLQQLRSLVEIIEHELVGVLQRGAPHRLVALVVLRKHDSRTFAVFAVVLVGFAEAFDQFRVCQRAGEIGFAATLVQQVQLLVVRSRRTDGIDTVENEVTAVDNGVQSSVNRLDLRIGGENVVPAPNVAVNARIAVHAIDQVGLDIGKQRQVPGIEGAAHEGGVNADDRLVHLADRRKRTVRRNRILRILVQTGGKGERRGRQHRIGFYFLNHHRMSQFRM